MLNNQIRIIAGKWRGRKISFDSANGLRPTSDRIRETVFNWLNPYIVDSRCLDLFAGSGALGIEALSRGAAQVTFIDNNRATIKKLQGNLKILESNQGEVVHGEAIQFIKHQDITKYDIIFIDPPYNDFTLLNVASLLENALIDKQYTIYYECYQAIEENKLPKNWVIDKQKKAGKVFFYLIKRSP